MNARCVIAACLALVAAAPAQSSRPAEARDYALEIFRKRTGLFIHWLAPSPERGGGIRFSNGQTPKTADEFADAIDVAKVCDEIAALRFEYVVLTDFHGFGTMLHPSKVSDRWRGPGYASRRDVIGEMIAALKARGIGVILFTHPLDGHDFSAEQQERLGWNDPAGGYRRWNDFINDVHAELTERYGKDLMAIGFDSEFALSPSKEWQGKLDRDRLRQTILSRKPDLSLMALSGPNETCELGMKEIWRPSWFDPWNTRPKDDYDVERWPAYRRCIGIVQGHHWATITPPSGGKARLTAEQMYRYTVLQAGTATEGPGVCWAASPYPDGLWEKDVREAFAKLASFMAPVSESLRDVYASRSYRTPEGSTLSGLPHGVVATRKTDDSAEYLHVLNPPAGRTLALPAPADGKRFTAATLLADGAAMELKQDDSGLRVTLPDGKSWQPLNTVIRLAVDPSTIAPRNLALHRPVIASSSIERDPAWPPRSDWNRIRVVDGQTRVTAAPQKWSSGNAGWSSARTKQDREEYVGVDLGGSVTIGEVCLYPRDDGEDVGQGFPLDFQIQVSPDGATWSTVVTQTNCPLPTEVQRFKMKEPLTTRFVRVLSTRLRANPADEGRYSFQLAELSVLAAEPPQSVAELWADFDPRKDALETEVIREWKEGGGVFRHVRYLIGTFKGKPARMAAIYGFPEGANGKLPAALGIHGGGQRASLSEVKYFVSRGYAALSVNWGGSGTGKAPFNSVQGALPGDPNTDWGAVDPSQLNAERYSSMLPGPKQFFEDREHPKNNNWYLLTIGCRRGLTFLERQPEVDPARLGVHGYSMGGNLTMYVAGTDARVKAAVPSVGGAGWRWQDHEFIGGTDREDRVQGDVEVFRRTLSFESYAPLIRCPVLHRSATNDFHGWMDDVYRTNALIPNQPTRYCFSPHFNHRLIPEVEIALPLWLDHFLKGGPALPETPHSELMLQTADHVPVLKVTANPAWPVSRCEIFYSVDPDPRARFWRSADVVREGDVFTAKLPLHTLDLPLFAFANVYHALPNPESLALLRGNPTPVREICISSLLHRMEAVKLREAGIAATANIGTLIDDFSRGFRDWYRLNAGNLTHQETWTRKVTDPMYRGADGAKLKLTLKMPMTNRLTFVVKENDWRPYRGRRNTFVCEREIEGSDTTQTITFEPTDFSSAGGALKSWAQIDELGICAQHPDRGSAANATRTWNGPAAEFLRLEWE